MNIAPNILAIRDISKKILRGDEFPHNPLWINMTIQN
jgi:hypothetical protein